MLKLLPIILAVAYGFLMYQFSVWRTHRTLNANSQPLRAPALTDMAARLARALDVPQVPVLVYDIDPVNGLASPDGRIFLTRGFLRKYHEGQVSAEEMASVIAHELGHVALGHTRRRMIDFTGSNAVFVVLSAVFARFIPFVGIWLARLIPGLLMSRLSRRDEFEADAWASALLIKAGIGTGPQKSLFRRLDQLTGSGGTRPPAWLASHPDLASRIRAIEANEARWGTNVVPLPPSVPR